MSNAFRAAAIGIFSLVCAASLDANDEASERRRAQLAELAKTLPVIDTSKEDCPDFDLKCQGHLDKGIIQVEVRYRKGGQFDIAVTNAVDDLPIGVWTRKRLVVFEPQTPMVFMTDNMD